jgi:hypothetical protein
MRLADELSKENFRVEFRSSDEFWLAGYFGAKTCVAVYRDGSWTKYTPKKTSWEVPRERRKSDDVLG